MNAPESDSVRALLEAAEEIADERAVDWDERTSELTDPQLRARYENLRELERIAAAFRAAGVAATGPAGKLADPLFTWGHLEALEKLGEGGFGEVYRAYDQALDRQVALKLRRGEKDRRISGGRFIREARRLARVRHPHVVSIFGADEHDGRVGFWTELIEGETLAEAIRRGEPMSADKALSVGREVCGALTAVHRAGLLHGDVKPANVMREQGGRHVLMDLGSATLMRAEVETAWPEATQGTPVAMAPEVLEGKTPTAASDIYSLGVLLYFLVAGTYPVRAQSFDELRQRHEQGDSVSLRDIRPKLPEPFLDVVDRALSPDPNDRYASAEEMEKALAQSLAELQSIPGHAEPQSRNLLGSVGIVAALAAASVGAWIWTDSRSQVPLAPGNEVTVGRDCVSNAQCTEALNAPAICRQGGLGCQQLVNDDCPYVIGDYADENAIIVGLMGSFSGPTPQHREWARAHLCATEMAMSWWAENPLPMIGQGGRRPLAILVCDGHEGNDRSLEHLAEAVGVNIMGGPNFSKHVLNHAPELASAGVFMLSPTAGAPQLMEMADNELFWSVQPNDAAFLPVYPPLLALAEERVKEVNATQDVVVALLADGDAMSRGMAQRLIETDSLEFNGMQAAEQTGDGFCPIYLCDSVTEPGCSNEEAANRLVQCDPDIVIYLAINLEWVGIHLGQVEAAGTRPYWLFPFRDAEVLELIRSGAANHGLAERLLAIDWTNEDNPTYTKFRASFTGACSRHVPPLAEAFPPLAENYYDWVFLAHLMYLAHGNHQVAPEALTGEDFANALVSLGESAGDPVEFLSANIPGLVQRLADGARVNVGGASGVLDFDPLLGTPSRPAEVFCVPSGPYTQSAEWVSSGLRFARDTGGFEGEFACPRRSP